MLEVWKGKKTYSEKQKKRVLTDGQVNTVINNCCSFLAPDERDKLILAIKEGSIGKEIDIQGTNIYARINNWLWKNEGFKFIDRDGDSNGLKKRLDAVTEHLIEYPISLEISNLMDWQQGEFGDGDSCFFGGHSVTRHYFNSLANFYTLKIYNNKDKSFGRCLILTDIPEKDCIILFNSYPGHRDRKYLELYADILNTFLGGKLNKSTHTIRNNKEGSWLYLNNSEGILLQIGDTIKEKEKIYLNLIERQPAIESIKGHLGKCHSCTLSIFKWTPDYCKDNKKILCKDCNTKYKYRTRTCFDCKKKISNIASRVLEYGRVDVERNGDLVIICSKCYKKGK